MGNCTTKDNVTFYGCPIFDYELDYEENAGSLCSNQLFIQLIMCI